MESNKPDKEAVLKNAWDNHFGAPEFDKSHLKINYLNVVYEAIESYSASQNSELRKENEELVKAFENNREQFMELATHAKDLESTIEGKDNEIEQMIIDKNKLLFDNLKWKAEIERLKELMEREIKKGFRAVARVTKTGNQITEEWINNNYEYFKAENNL